MHSEAKFFIFQILNPSCVVLDTLPSCSLQCFHLMSKNKGIRTVYMVSEASKDTEFRVGPA